MNSITEYPSSCVTAEPQVLSLEELSMVGGGLPQPTF